MAPRLTRLTQPLVRDGGQLREASWDEALDRAAAGFRKALDEGSMTGLFSCSKTTNELNFATQKFSRVALHSRLLLSCAGFRSLPGRCCHAPLQADSRI